MILQVIYGSKCVSARRLGVQIPSLVFGLLLALITAGCDFIPRKVTMDAPRIQPLLKAAASFDRVSYGFTSLPRDAYVRWESRPTDRYDAMLHIYSKTSRTIAFRKIKNGYQWIGEQEIFEGPKKYT